MGNNFYGLDDNDFEHRSFEINGRTVEYKTAVTAKIEQDFAELNEKDKEFISYCLVDADILMKQLDPAKDISNYSAHDLDTLLDLWQNKRSFFKLVNEDEFVNAIGSAFGNCINRNFNTIWTVISDEYGTDYACVSENPKFQTFPFSSVWKTIEQNKKDCLQNIIDLIAQHIKDNTFLSQ